MSAAPDSQMSNSATALADFCDWLQVRAEQEFDVRELADMIWLTLEREKWVKPESEQAAESSEDRGTANDVAIIDVPGLPDEPSVPEVAVPVAQSAESNASLVSETSPQLEETFGSPLPISLPDTSPLPNALALSRALYPLMRRVPSRSREYLDEEATVTQISDQRIHLPVMCPVPERWLELALVIEDTSILEIWQETITAFQKLMERHGAFRDVRTWYLQADALGELSLYRQRQNTEADMRRARPRSLKELSDASGRRLILLMSDCTSDLWRLERSGGSLPQQLLQWSRQTPVTVVQLLPEHFWERSALGRGFSVWLRAQDPGVVNAVLQVEGLRPRQKDRIQEQDRELLKLPIITLDAAPMRDWAKVLTGVSDAETAGVVLGVSRPQSRLAAEFREVLHSREAASVGAPSDEIDQSSGATAQQRLTRFLATASPAARQLAGMMALLPVSLPVVRLIQRNLLDGQGPTVLAEIFLSGLIQTQPHFEFVPGVRNRLLKATPLETATNVQTQVVEDLEGGLPPELRSRLQEVKQRLSEDIEQRIGLSRRQFEAFLVPGLLRDWLEAGELDAAVGPVVLPLAELSSQVLRALGGDWAQVAEQLERVTPALPQSLSVGQESLEDEPDLLPMVFEPLEVETAQLIEIDDIDPWPTLQTEIITIATVTFEDDGPDSNLERFEFTTATLAKQQQRQGFLSGLFSRQQQAQWVIQKQRGAAYRLVESLPQDIALEMVQIPAGSFMMGSPGDEPERSGDEGPQHEVTFSAFLMGRCPITQAQWRAVSALDQVEQALEPDPSNFKGNDRPVEKVSWQDAIEFCRRLSQHTGRDYRLPTEAEWEYACRAGTTTPFHFGETITTDLANYRGTDDKEYNWSGSYGDGPKGEYREETTPVGSFPANAFGLCDMHGNVWEWCQDHYHDSYKGAPKDGAAWIDDSPGKELRVQRGGSWLDRLRDCRSARRDWVGPFYRNLNNGFRVVCAAPRT